MAVAGSAIAAIVVHLCSSPPVPVIDSVVFSHAVQLAHDFSVVACGVLDDAFAIKCAGHAARRALDKLELEPVFHSPCIKLPLIRQWIHALLNIAVAAEASKGLRSQGLVDWDVLQPFATCPGEERLGYIGDGGKWVCLPLDATRRNSLGNPAGCLAYSFGVRTDSSFEDAMAGYVGCEVHEFDPSPELIPPPSFHPEMVSFRPWGLRSTNERFYLLGADVQGYTLASIMKQLGHTGRTIDVLKVDIEESEWSVLEQLLSTGEPLPFHQLQVELHFLDDRFDSWKAVQLIAGMLQRGFLPFHKELNGYSPKSVTEASFVSAAWLASDSVCAPVA